MSLTSAPRLIKGGLVVMAPGGGAVRNTIALQYNPDSLTRSYQVQAGACAHVPSVLAWLCYEGA